MMKLWIGCLVSFLGVAQAQLSGFSPIGVGYEWKFHCPACTTMEVVADGSNYTETDYYDSLTWRFTIPAVEADEAGERILLSVHVSRFRLDSLDRYRFLEEAEYVDTLLRRDGAVQAKWDSVPMPGRETSLPAVPKFLPFFRQDSVAPASPGTEITFKTINLSGTDIFSFQAAGGQERHPGAYAQGVGLYKGMLNSEIRTDRVVISAGEVKLLEYDTGAGAMQVNWTENPTRLGRRSTFDRPPRSPLRTTRGNPGFPHSSGRIFRIDGAVMKNGPSLPAIP